MSLLSGISDFIEGSAKKAFLTPEVSWSFTEDLLRNPGEALTNLGKYSTMITDGYKKASDIQTGQYRIDKARATKKDEAARLKSIEQKKFEAYADTLKGIAEASKRTPGSRQTLLTSSSLPERNTLLTITGAGR